MNFAQVTATVIIFTNSLSITGAHAHCPEEQTIMDTPDHSLAGIDATQDRYERVLELFGKPQEIYEFEEPITNTINFEENSHPPGTGEVLYTWYLGDAKLKVYTMYNHDSEGQKIESVTGVMAMGPRGTNKLRTGRGVGLGSTREQVTLSYGSIYIKGPFAGSGTEANTITYCFETDDKIEFEFDDAGYVVQIFLLPSIE